MFYESFKDVIHLIENYESQKVWVIYTREMVSQVSQCWVQRRDCLGFIPVLIPLQHTASPFALAHRMSQSFHNTAYHKQKPCMWLPAFSLIA